MRRWPLHPQPSTWEPLGAYVRRLADAYGTRLETFGRRALGIEPEIVRNLDRVPRRVLERLSAGTGVSLERLEGMRSDRLWTRLVEEIERLLATEDGREALARFRPMASPSRQSSFLRRPEGHQAPVRPGSASLSPTVAGSARGGDAAHGRGTSSL